ncbi:hypothetical protein [Microbacterium gorillae]|uniref:hypothetical protein n=1 Tax=Microbacterium gorillae TaxID=1231063 RepID=UPI003D95EEC1
MSHETSVPRRPAAVRILTVTAVVLLLATVALGFMAFRLWGERPAAAPEASTPTPTSTRPSSPSASPTPSPSLATPLPATQPQLTSQGVPVVVRGDFTVRELAMTRWEPDAFTRLLAPVELPEDATLFGTVYLDVTAYDAEGNIIDRSPTLFTWRPGQTRGLINTLMKADLPSAAQFVIEQTKLEEEAFDVTGELTVASVTVGEAVGLQALADFALNSTLSRDLEVADVGILGFADGRLFAACVTPVDVPVGAVFADDCIWESASSEFVPDAPPTPPAGATYEVTLSLR